MIAELRQRRDLTELPTRAAYREIIKTLRELRPDSLGEDAVLFLTLADFDGEVTNGGLAQYFTNPYGRNYRAVLDGLRRVGLEKQRGILNRWLELLPPEVPPEEANIVGQYIFGQDERMKASQNLDSEYYGERDEFRKSIVRWALEG